MATTLTASAAACPKCGCQEQAITEQRFRDGTTHRRASCQRCGAFIKYLPKQQQAPSARQPLPIAASPAPPTTIPPAGNSTLARALDALDVVNARSVELREGLRSKPPDQAGAAALFGAALAASANLSPENIGSLTNAVRQGQLPRRKGA